MPPPRVGRSLRNGNDQSFTGRAGRECSVVILLANGTDLTPWATLTVNILAVPVEANLFSDFCVPIMAAP